MQITDKELTQKKRIAAELANLNKNITEADRYEFMEEKNLSRTSLSKYMNGKARNVDLAIEMLLFFRKKIAAREKIINQNN